VPLHNNYNDGMLTQKLNDVKKHMLLAFLQR